MEPLLLGVCDGPCSLLSLSPFENKIGGLPDFFPEVQLTNPPSCSSCHGVMLHLLQAYCPLEGSAYHRILHVFCCSQPSCWKNKGWLVLRSQKKESVTPSPPLPSHQTLSPVEDWCDGANDWEIQSPYPQGTSTQLTEVAMVTSTLDQLNLDDKPELTKMYTSVTYPSYHIAVTPARQGLTLAREEELLRSYYQEYSHMTTECEGAEESYERLTGVDQKFFKFKKEMTKCPQQLIRYQRGGKPLLLEEVGVVHHCDHCDSPCVFELQLLPQIIYLLQEGLRKATPDPSQGTLTLPVVEYGTVLIYTCQQSCWNKEGCGQFCKEIPLVQQVDDER